MSRRPRRAAARANRQLRSAARQIDRAVLLTAPRCDHGLVLDACPRHRRPGQHPEPDAPVKLRRLECAS